MLPVTSVTFDLANRKMSQKTANYIESKIYAVAQSLERQGKQLEKYRAALKRISDSYVLNSSRLIEIAREALE